MCEMGDMQMANCYFASDVTATMLVDKNKRVSLPWELNAFCVQIQRKNLTVLSTNMTALLCGCKRK